MELQANHGQLTVTQGHDRAVVGPGGDFQAVGQRRLVDHQRMVAATDDRVRQVLENTSAVVSHERSPTVYRLSCPNDSAPERFSDRLMAQADAQKGHLPMELPHDLQRTACLAGRTGPRRKDHCLRPECANSRHVDRRIALNPRPLPQAFEVSGQVVDEAVVIVDQKDHAYSPGRINVYLPEQSLLTRFDPDCADHCKPPSRHLAMFSREVRLFSSTVMLLWATLPANFAGCGASDAVLGGEASGQPSVIRAVRGIQVHRVWGASGMESDEKNGMSLYAHVEALGLRWRSLVVEVRLRTAEGKPVPVAAGAPEGYADEQGEFCMSARAPVFDDRFEWKALRASFPYEKVLDLPAGRTQRLIATFQASSSGLSSLAEAEITIPPDPAPGARRAVGLLAVDLFADSGPTNNQRGLTVESYVEAVGLVRSKLLGRLSFRREDGQSLTSDDGGTGAKRPFESVVKSDVVSDQAQILAHFIPYRAIGLGPGRHRLVLTYYASCEGLTAKAEEEYVLHEQ